MHPILSHTTEIVQIHCGSGPCHVIRLCVCSSVKKISTADFCLACTVYRFKKKQHLGCAKVSLNSDAGVVRVNTLDQKVTEKLMQSCILVLLLLIEPVVLGCLGFLLREYGVTFMSLRDSVMAVSPAFRSINPPDNSLLSHSVLPVLFLPYWSFQLHISF